MKVLLIGNEKQVSEMTAKLDGHEIVNASSSEAANFDVVFDLQLDRNSEALSSYAGLENKVVFVGSVRKSLSEMVAEQNAEIKCSLVGINNIPSFINKDLSECVLYNPNEQNKVAEIASQLGLDPRFIADRVGMASPRIILSIINEACYTLQEGTAGIEDIDQAMKLGTNYPGGPFEWADAMGIDEVYEGLDAIWKDTGDDRYRICPLLKTYYIKKESFYS